MSIDKILFTPEGKAKTPEEIHEKVVHFKYADSVSRIIRESQKLDDKGKIFIQCASFILLNFGMTRGGPFKGAEKQKAILHDCWNEIGDSLISINNSVIESGLSRGRYLLELNEKKREELISEIWFNTKQILLFTMGKYSYGLVGASKILFSVLPEIVLPIDNSQWLNVFKTVDLGDVIRRMVSEIQLWERVTGRKLNEMGDSRKLATLPSIYNVMAMAARPKSFKKEVRKVG
ncbi:hypothetical protein ACFLV5_04145 [Chloroflexota bacterium]